MLVEACAPTYPAAIHRLCSKFQHAQMPPPATADLSACHSCSIWINEKKIWSSIFRSAFISGPGTSCHFHEFLDLGVRSVSMKNLFQRKSNLSMNSVNIHTRHTDLSARCWIQHTLNLISCLTYKWTMCVARNPNKSRNKGRITQLKFIDLKIWKI